VLIEYRYIDAQGNEIIELRANIHAQDKDQSMPIHFIKSYKVAALLLDKGALANVKNAKSLTPIFFAPDDRTLKLLISKGAKLDVSTKEGNTPIAYARNPSVIRYLISKGANVNSQNDLSETPLHHLITLSASSNQQRDSVIKLLIRKGANVDMRDSHGWSPLYYSIKDCDMSAAQLFYIASRDVRKQLGYKRLRGQISAIRKSNPICWKKVKTAVAKSGKLRSMKRKKLAEARLRKARAAKAKAASSAMSNRSGPPLFDRKKLSLSPDVRKKRMFVKPGSTSAKAIKTGKRSVSKRVRSSTPAPVILNSNPESEPGRQNEEGDQYKVIDKSSPAGQ